MYIERCFYQFVIHKKPPFFFKIRFVGVTTRILSLMPNQACACLAFKWCSGFQVNNLLNVEDARTFVEKAAK